MLPVVKGPGDGAGDQDPAGSPFCSWVWRAFWPSGGAYGVMLLPYNGRLLQLVDGRP